MRQMKRALSLILAMIMLLGMVMVPSGAASSSFIDADLIENTDAVTITSGIGLFAGTTDGRFAPKATVTRAQMATIIVKMLNGSDFNADAFKGVGVNPFPDTASFEGGWAEGYINACYQMGVVSGYGDGKFRPANELTTAEALTMIINALGVDPGQGEWPLNYMAKAEEMKLYGDLAKIPATDEPLNRDQLSVIVLAGLEYSPAGRSGWQIPGTDLVFEEYVDALKANGGNPEGVNPVVGDDALASKVYGLKKMAGFITGNQTTGLEYTELSFLNANKDDRETAMFGIESGLDLVGHYVTVYYKEKYTSEQKPGKTYAIVDESTAVTVKENIDNAKDYKAVFGQSYDLHNDYVVRITADYNLGKFCGSMKASEYAKGTKAIKGTYIIAGGKVRAYIDPVPTYATYISDVGSIQMEEYVSLIGVDSIGNRGVLLRLSMAEGDSQVIAYDGMKTGDFVTYQKVQNLYVISPVRKITGIVNKTAHPTINNSVYDSITVDGVEYMSFESNDVVTSNSFIGTKLDNDLSKVEFGTGYDLYLAEDGSYIGFEPTSGGVVLEDTVYLLGSFVVREMDQYGATRWYRKVRGINMSGEEVMLVQGSVKDDGVKNENGLPVYDSAKDTEDQLGTMATVLEGFFTVKEPTEKKEREEDIKVLTPFGASYSPETPTYALKPNSTSTVFTGTNTVATAEGIAAIGTTGMKFFVLGGSLTDSAPLTVSTGIPNAFYPTTEQAAASYMLVTRQPSGAMSNINIWIYRNDAKTGKEVPFYATQEQIDAPGENVDGKVYTVYSASTGKEMELILDPKSGVALTTPGMYVATQDSDGITFAIGQVNVAETPNFEDGKAQVVNNIGFWGLTTNRLRGERLASVSGGSGVKIDMINGWVNGAAGASVIDLRTEDEMRASGVGKITSLSQMVSMRESDPGMMIIYDLYMEDASNGTSGTTKTVFITRVVRGTVGMNSVVYAWKDPVPGDEMMIVRSLSATMGDRVKVDFEVCRNGGPGFYRYCVDADGKLCLVPYDDKAVSTGSYGMYAMHEELTGATVIDTSTLLLTTVNASHGGCGYNCTDAGVEPLKEFYITAATTTILDENGKEIPFENFHDLFLSSGLVINYYCDTPVNNKNSTDKDTSAELIVISSRADVTVSCDGSCQNGTPVASAADISGSGSYYLTGDISDLSLFSGDVKLCLNGHSINGAITVDGGSLALSNCEGREGGQVTGAVTVNGGTFTMGDAVTANTGASVASGANFVMDGGTITGGTAGGVNNAGTFTMNGGKITGNSGSNGAGVVNSGTFTMNNGAISGNKATSNGGGIYVNGGTVTMNNGTISGNTGGSSGKGIGVNIAKGTFNMNGGTISGHSTSSTGAGIQVNGGTFNMSGGTITGNTAQTYGGGVCVQTGAFNMTGGTIAGNTCTNADSAGVDVANSYYSAGVTGGPIVISGGTIGTQGSTARNLVVNANTVTIQGSAVINGNVVTTGTGNKAALNVRGGTINGNVINGDAPNGGYLEQQKKTFDCELSISGGVINGDVAKGSGDWQIGVSMGNVSNAAISGGTFEGDVSDADISGGTFNAEVTNSTITGGTFDKLPEGALGEGFATKENPDGSVTIIRNSCSKPGHATGTVITADTNLLRDSGFYYLSDNVTANGAIRVMGDVTLCLNSYALTAPDGLNGAFISVAAGKTLTICGGVSGTGTIVGLQSGTGIQVNGTLVMESGIVTGFGDNGIKVAPIGTLNMVGGEIRNNTGTEGGGVYSAGDFVMTGGTIKGNTATSGGGVYLADGGHMTISGSAAVIANTATTDGGGVRIAGGGTLTMNGGQIDSNIGTTRGGGVLLEGSSASKLAILEMNEGSISYNKADHYGGGVSLRKFNQFTMNGGTISGNTFTGGNKYGTQITIGNNTGSATGNFTMNNGTIDGSGVNGYAVPLLQGVAVIKGGTIIGEIGTVGALGGSCSLTIEGGTFEGPVSKNVIPMPSGYTRGAETLQVSGGIFNKTVSNAVISGGTFNAGVIGSAITGGTFTALEQDALAAQVDSAYKVEGVSGNLTVVPRPADEEPEVPVVTTCALHGNHEGWTEISGAANSKITAAGNYVLTADLTEKAANAGVAGCLTVEIYSGDNDVNICLNGHSITPSDVGAAIYVASGKVNLTNGMDTVSVIKSGTSRAVCVGNNSGDAVGTRDILDCLTIESDNIVIDGGKTGKNGVEVFREGRLVMNAGTVTNVTGTNGAVCVRGGDFEMNAGTITGNTTHGVRVVKASAGEDTYGVFTMNGGTISNNTSAGAGGGVYVDANATCILNGGIITGNKTSNSGNAGGVYLVAKANFEMNGGTISDNTGYNGGGIHAEGNSVTITGGTISGNQATGNNGGGGICLFSTSTLNIVDGVFTNNKAAASGGAVCIGKNVTFTLGGGTISGNTAANGNGLCQFPDGAGSVSIVGGNIQDAMVFSGKIEKMQNVTLNMDLKDTVIIDCTINGNLTNCTISGDNTVVNGIVTGGSISGGKFDVMTNAEETLKGLLVAGKALELSGDLDYWVVVDAPAAINESVEEI